MTGEWRNKNDEGRRWGKEKEKEKEGQGWGRFATQTASLHPP